MLKWCSGVCGFSQHLDQVRGTLLLKRKTLPIETPQVSVFEENHCLDRIFNMKLWGHNPLISLILLLSIIFILHPRKAKGCYVFSSCLLGGYVVESWRCVSKKRFSLPVWGDTASLDTVDFSALKIYPGCIGETYIFMYMFIYDLQKLCIKLQWIDEMQNNHKEIHEHIHHQ